MALDIERAIQHHVKTLIDKNVIALGAAEAAVAHSFTKFHEVVSLEFSAAVSAAENKAKALEHELEDLRADLQKNLEELLDANRKLAAHELERAAQAVEPTPEKEGSDGVQS